MDTIEWVLKDIDENYGFRRNVLCVCDGCEVQNWSRTIFGEFPKVIERYARGRAMGVVRLMKTVGGHGKGEIDSCHGAPKNALRKHIQLASAVGRGRDELLGGFEDATQIVSWLQSQGRFECRLTDTSADSKGFTLTMRRVKYYEPTDAGNII